MFIIFREFKLSKRHEFFHEAFLNQVALFVRCARYAENGCLIVNGNSILVNELLIIKHTII